MEYEINSKSCFEISRDFFSFFQFNDRGPDINLNVEVREPTDDVVRFKQEIIGLEFESYNGGRDSKERLMQGKNFAI